MRVIICEDNFSQLEFFKSEIVKYASFHLPSVAVTLCASKPKEVLNYINQYSADCYFLNIELEGNMDGLELASAIRETDPVANIIFITNLADKINLTFKYKIAALDYIVKVPDKEKLAKNIIGALKIAYKRYIMLGQNNFSDFFQIKIGDIIKNIKYDDIYYFETSIKAHKLILHTKYGIHEFYGKLKDVEKMDKRFCRCHNSYCINIDYLEQYTPRCGKLLMKNGHECLVSYRYSKNLKKVTNPVLLETVSPI